MADIINDGMTRIWWVTSISNTAAPTAAEITAGVDLTGFTTADGLEDGGETAGVDTTSLGSTSDTETPGRRTNNVELTMKNQGMAAAPWTTFASRPAGFFVKRSLVSVATAATAAQKVLVIPATAGDRHEIKPTKNELAKFKVKLFTTGAAVEATVA